MLKLSIPEKVNLSWGDDFVKVEGPLGVLIKKRANFQLAEVNSSVYLWVEDQKKGKENFYMNLLNRLMIGVSQGFRQRLKLVGVGFKASLRDNKLILKIGFSHEVIYEIPSDVKIFVSKNKGTFILIKGKEKDRVLQVAKNIRSFREPDAFKGKGIHYNKERLVLKKGKKDSK